MRAPPPPAGSALAIRPSEDIWRPQCSGSLEGKSSAHVLLAQGGADGLQLQDELSRRGVGLPLIIITAHGEVSSAVTALRAGAVDFLEKPFDDEVFLRRVHEALQRDADQRRDRSAAISARVKLARLSPRERDVAGLMVEGCANKAIANRLGIGVRTVETHRANILSKLDIRTIPDLLRLWMHVP